MAQSQPFALTAKPSRQAQAHAEFQFRKITVAGRLAQSILMGSEDELTSEARWKSRGLEPFHHQATNLVTFCRRLPATLLADEVGLGKTISAGLIASGAHLPQAHVQPSRRVPESAGPQWKEELESKFGIPDEFVIGNKLIDAEPRDEIGAVITTYNSARLYLAQIPKDRFHMLVFDEAHKLRNLYGAPCPPQVALCFRNVLENRMFKYVLMLTATPI